MENDKTVTLEDLHGEVFEHEKDELEPQTRAEESFIEALDDGFDPKGESVLDSHF